MIWSIIKLSLGCAYMFGATIANCITWLLYFGWSKDMYTLFWTDKNANIQYYYNGNVLAWAFQIKRLADSSFDLTMKVSADEK